MNIKTKKGSRKADATSKRASFFLLAAMGIALMLPATAGAGMVSGEVREGGKPLKEAEIEVKDSRNNSFKVKTDKNGKYSVNLPPGIYKATGGKDKSKGVLIQSSPQPSRQDIEF